jgi:hypothetical protein
MVERYSKDPILQKLHSAERRGVVCTEKKKERDVCNTNVLSKVATSG